MTKISGVAYPPATSQKYAASIVRTDDNRVYLYVEEQVIECSVEELAISPDIANVPLKVYFLCGWTFIPDDKSGIFAYLKRPGLANRFITKLESNFVSIVMCLFIVGACGLWGYRYALPWVSVKISNYVPDRAYVAAGEYMLEQLDIILKPSKLSFSVQNRVRDRVSQLQPELCDFRYPIKIHFRSGSSPNAFALLGGHIVLLDEMVGVAKTQSQLDSIIFHELGHVCYQHVENRAVYSVITSVLSSLVINDSSDLIQGLVGSGGFILTQGLSREDEKAADDFSKNAMIKIYGSIQPMVDIYKALNHSRETIPEWLSSHPSFDHRLESINKK